MGNWMWGVILVAAAAHALRCVPPAAEMRQLKIPGAFAALYVLYAVALAVAGFAGLLAALAVVEIALQIVRRRWPERWQVGSAKGRERGR